MVLPLLRLTPGSAIILQCHFGTLLPLGGFRVSDSSTMPTGDLAVMLVCLSASLVLQLMKCHLPRWWLAIIVYFFPTSFHDLFFPSLPAGSLAWNIFSPLSHRIQTSSQFCPLPDKCTGNPRLQSPALQICFIFSAFKYSSYLWVYLNILDFLFQYFFCHCYRTDP